MCITVMNMSSRRSSENSFRRNTRITQDVTSTTPSERNTERSGMPKLPEETSGQANTSMISVAALPARAERIATSLIAPNGAEVMLARARAQA